MERSGYYIKFILRLVFGPSQAIARTIDTRVRELTLVEIYRYVFSNDYLSQLGRSASREFILLLGGDPIERAGFIGVTIFTGVANVLMLTGPVFMLQLFDRVLTSHSTAALRVLHSIWAGRCSMWRRCSCSINGWDFLRRPAR